MNFAPAVLSDAEVLWNYHRLGCEIEAADVILGLGSYDISVAEYASRLFLRGLGRWLMFTGGIVSRSDLLQTPWSAPEADVFAERARELGVSEERLVIEAHALNTSENFLLSLQVLLERGIACTTLVVVTKPNMERRARATAAVTVPREISVSVTSPPTTFDEYIRTVEVQKLINLMVGDLQRIELYPELGFQAPEPIPSEVNRAFRRLVQAGFTHHLIAPPNKGFPE